MTGYIADMAVHAQTGHAQVAVARSGGEQAARTHGVIGVDHVGIAVADLDTAIEWYGSTFGLVVTPTETNEDQGVREAMLSAPGDTGAAVQLLAPLRPDSPIGRFLDRNGPGIQQMAYRVADIDVMSAALRGRGMRLLYDEPRRGTAGSRINFVHPKDAGGVLVELVELARRSPER